MAQLFANNAFGVLANAVNGAATTLVLVSGQGAKFPLPTGGDYFLATLIGLDANGAESSWEIVRCNARSTDQLTVLRAQEGTVATSWNAGTRIELRWTKAGADNKANVDHVHSKADIGLGNVDNTSDANKPISTATQTALNAKAPLTGAGTSGTWPINVSGRSGAFDVIDDRNVVSQPNQVPDRSGVFNFRFKENVGNPPFPANYMYAHVLTVNGWAADGTGGWPTQMSFGERLSYRKGATSTTWGAWRQLIDSSSIGEFAPSLTGAGATGNWGISVTGNAATATKLATARTLTIGATGKSFDGSAVLSWTLAEIGAVAASHAGSGATAHAAATTSVDGFMSAADKTKLNGIATSATANSTDAQLRDRATHTGTQAISTVSGLQTALDAKASNVTSYVNVSGTTTASAFSRYHLTASLDLTLPSNPSDGDWVDVVNHSGTKTARVLRNGQNINNLAEDMTLDLLWAPVRFVFRTGYGWFIA